MRRGYAGLAGLLLLAGCGGEVPGFLGREGTGESSFELGDDPEVVAVPVQLREARIERSTTGVIVLAFGVTPTQGYHTARLAPVDDGLPDAAGLLSYRFIALPPEGPEAVGSERTRGVQAAAYIPERALGDFRGVRVVGAGTSRTLPIR